MHETIYLTEEIGRMLQKENTAIARNAYEYIDSNLISIVGFNDCRVFYFEGPSYGSGCPKRISDWLVKYVNRKTGFTYLSAYMHKGC